MSSPKANTWYKVPKLNLAVSARRAGFDLSIFDDYSASVQTELRRHTIKQMMTDLRERVFEEHGFELRSFDKSVYVISLAYPLIITYPAANSHVLYIGLGHAGSRIESHFKNKLFDFMQSLSGAEFTIHLALPKRAGSAQYFKHVEHLMLEHFAYYYGGAEKAFPLMNKNRGSNKKLSTDTQWWASAIDRIGKKPIWMLNPMDRPKNWVLD